MTDRPIPGDLQNVLAHVNHAPDGFPSVASVDTSPLVGFTFVNVLDVSHLR
jgi:hypothetical protein